MEKTNIMVDMMHEAGGVGGGGYSRERRVDEQIERVKR